jgi:hypothetical protein
MKIELQQFGKILISRPSGKEAFEAFRAYTLPTLPSPEVELSFDGVTSIGPSWLDEFVSGLKAAGVKVQYQKTDNPSAIKSIEIIEESA